MGPSERWGPLLPPRGFLQDRADPGRCCQFSGAGANGAGLRLYPLGPRDSCACFATLLLAVRMGGGAFWVFCYEHLDEKKGKVKEGRGGWGGGSFAEKTGSFCQLIRGEPSSAPASVLLLGGGKFWGILESGVGAEQRPSLSTQPGGKLRLEIDPTLFESVIRPGRKDEGTRSSRHGRPAVSPRLP